MNTGFRLDKVKSFDLYNVKTGENLLHIDYEKDCQEEKAIVKNITTTIEDLVPLKIKSNEIELDIYVDEENFTKLQKYQK